MDHPLRASEPFLLVGLLANYDKFETHNQYRVRLADYVNEDAMQKVIESIGWTCKLLQDRYLAILDDTPTAWSIGGTLSYVGLGALTRSRPAAPTLSEDEQRVLFGEQYVQNVLSVVSVPQLTLTLFSDLVQRHRQYLLFTTLLWQTRCSVNG